LRLGVLPEGYIYPPETRPLRDLLRKRSQLVKLRTGLILSFQSMVARNLGFSVKGVDLSKKAAEYQEQYWSDRPELSLIADANLTVIDSLNRQIDLIEKAVRHRWKIKEGYPQLLSIPGVGYIIGMTIELETGPISRFGRVGDYVSYCRKVNSQWTSNNKLKGSGNRKNGNRYLAWAFSEAAEFARRYNESCRAFYNRKLKKNHMMVARSALAHKLARAAYYIMRDNVPFDERKLFS
jgi:transposase